MKFAPQGRDATAIQKNARNKSSTLWHLLHIFGPASHRKSRCPRRAKSPPLVLAKTAAPFKTSLHWGLSPGPSVYRTDALPLSYRGLLERQSATPLLRELRGPIMSVDALPLSYRGLLERQSAAPSYMRSTQTHHVNWSRHILLACETSRLRLSYASTPCGTQTHNLRIRGPTPCPLGQGGHVPLSPRDIQQRTCDQAIISRSSLSSAVRAMVL